MQISILICIQISKHVGDKFYVKTNFIILCWEVQ